VEAVQSFEEMRPRHGEALASLRGHRPAPLAAAMETSS
jgi:hypothetical protein